MLLYKDEFILNLLDFFTRDINIFMNYFIHLF